MRRIAVIGCGGAGKTTTARGLGHALGLPVIHGDELRADWERVHGELVARDEWVIDAMRVGTLDARLARADTVVYLDRSAVACLAGVVLRRLRYRGRDLGDGVVDRINWEFVSWILRFRRRDRPRVLEVLDSHRASTRVVVLRSVREARRFVASV